MIYPLPEMPLNTQGMKDDGKFFRRKINLAKVLIICDVDSYPNICVVESSANSSCRIMRI